jgi:2-methylisocitrate lyase-like PEP mutase family enzyme
MTTVETDQAGRAARFRAMHRGTVLVLPNAWDPGSAAVIEAAGAQAIATTSAGVSWANGASDAEGLDRQQMVAAIARIVRAVSVPVTADIEGGYGPDPEDVAATVRAVLAAGAVGINLEDAPGPDGTPLHPVDAQAQRIAAARAAAVAAGVDLFINARTDVYLRAVGAPDGRLADVKARAAAYADAGADGLFVPGILDLDVIAQLAEGPLPLNVMAGPGAPLVGELAGAGAARVSVGASIAQAAYRCAARAATELLTDGTYDALAQGIDYGNLNALLRPNR